MTEVNNYYKPSVHTTGARSIVVTYHMSDEDAKIISWLGRVGYSLAGVIVLAVIYLILAGIGVVT